MYRQLVAVIIALSLCPIARASTLVATFEPGCCDVESGYLLNGLQWDDFLTLDVNEQEFYGPEHTHSGNWVATTRFGERGVIFDNGPIGRTWDFVGTWLSSPELDNVLVTVNGYRIGSSFPVFTQEIAVSQQSTNWYQFDFTDIGQVSFETAFDINLAFDDMEFRKDGDANGDFLVTIEDLNAVRNNFGTSEILGDANSDGIVNIHDLNEVRNHFEGGAAEVAAPEPSSALLALMLLILVPKSIRCRRSTSSSSSCSSALS